jgi:hypothetical protein
MTTLEQARQRLRIFAEREAIGISPLYEHLAAKAAEDDEVAGLLTAAPVEFSSPTLLMAAIHRVLQSEPVHPLVAYYPSLGGSSGPDAGTWPLFREFALEHTDRVRELVATRTTQTNEVRRAATLYPGIALAAKEARGPIGLLEVGCSAGLLLGLDKYGYRYQTEEAGQLAVGPSKTPLGLHCALELAEGAALPKLPKKITVGAKVGLDRNPLDLDDEESYAWLEACIWPDQPQRRQLFGVAAAMRAKDPPQTVRGDAVDDLPSAAALVPEELPLVVMTSHALTYLTEGRRADFVRALGKLAGQRPLWWVSKEDYRGGLNLVLPGREDLIAAEGRPWHAVLGLVRWSGGEPVARALALTSAHGERLTWLG